MSLLAYGQKEFPVVDIKGLDKAEVLAALYNAAKPQGMGFMHYDPKPMTVEEARKILTQYAYFDYLKGRVMKVDLNDDTFDPWGYDRDNGQGRAQEVIDSLRATGSPNNITIRAQHISATRQSIQDTRDQLSEESTLTVVNGVPVARLGLSDVAEVLEPTVEKAEKSLQSPLD